MSFKISEGDSKRTSDERTGQSSGSGGVDDMHPSSYESEKERTTDLLCSACDRCRAKKTKCDGERPCDACKTFYMRENKLKNMEGVDLTAIGCSYSLAKKRGPPPATRNNPQTKSSSSSDNIKERKKKKHKKRHEGEQVHAAQPQVPQVPPVGMMLPHSAVEDSTTTAATTAAFILNLLNSITMQPSGGLQQAAGNPLLFPSPVSNPFPQQQQQQQLAFGGATGPTLNNPYVANTPSNSAISQQPQLAFLQQLIQLVCLYQEQQQQSQQQQHQQQLLQQIQQQIQQIPAQQGQLQQLPSSSLSSSDEAKAEGGGSLRSEVDQLKERVRRLEAENERLKESIESLHAKESSGDEQ